MKNVVLIGFMGCGKTTVGRRLASLLDMGFIDSDAWISSQHGRSCREIIDTDGEPAFRRFEMEFVEIFKQTDSLIIATGGGMPIYCDIACLGLVVYLKADFDTILKRVSLSSVDNRPLFRDKDKALDLYCSREGRYFESADLIIDSSLSLRTTANSVVRCLK